MCTLRNEEPRISKKGLQSENNKANIHHITVYIFLYDICAAPLALNLFCFSLFTKKINQRLGNTLISFDDSPLYEPELAAVLASTICSTICGLWERIDLNLEVVAGVIGIALDLLLRTDEPNETGKTHQVHCSLDGFAHLAKNNVVVIGRKALEIVAGVRAEDAGLVAGNVDVTSHLDGREGRRDSEGKATMRIEHRIEGIPTRNGLASHDGLATTRKTGADFNHARVIPLLLLLVPLCLDFAMAKTILDPHGSSNTLGISDHGSKLGIVRVHHRLPPRREKGRGEQGSRKFLARNEIQYM